MYNIINAEKQAGANVSQISNLWLFESRHVFHFPYPKTNPLTASLPFGMLVDANDLVLYITASVIDLSFFVSKANFEGKLTENQHGNANAYNISVAIPKQSPMNLLTTDRLSKREYIAVLRDGNNYYRIVGTPEQPLRFEASEQSTGKNGQNYGFKTIQANPACFISNWEAYTQTKIINGFVVVGSALLLPTDNTDFSSQRY
jgi:hypothetical protein